jgi:hypothetical protein
MRSAAGVGLIIQGLRVVSYISYLSIVLKKPKQSLKVVHALINDVVV